jgi:membrane protease subunit HflK
MFLNDDDENPWAADDEQPPKPRKRQEKRGEPPRSPENRNVNPNGFDDIIIKLQDRFKKMNKSGKGTPPIPPVPSKGMLVTAGVAALALWLGSGFYRVQEGELALVLRFGKMNRISEAGLRYRLPYPFENEIIRKVAVLNKIDGGLNEASPRTAADNVEQTLILTGDENMVHTNYTVLWKIHDIAHYVFTARDPETTIRMAAESAIREVIGQTTARSALTEGRDKIGTNAQELLQKILDSYNLGVQIVSVQLQRVEPPAQVIKAFNDMQASLVDADRMKNEAEAYQNDKIPRARGEAQKIVQDAAGYREQTILNAQGDAARFNAIANAAGHNRDIARILLFSKTVPQLLAKAPKTVVDGKVGQGAVPFYNLQNQSPIKFKKGEN